MNYNKEKFKKEIELMPVKHIKDVFVYENTLYKRIYAGNSYNSCKKCDFVECSCYGKACHWQSYFKKIDSLPVQCDTCGNYKPESMDNLPNTLEEIKKIIWSKDVDITKLDLMTNLIKARDIYRQGWKPDWEDSDLDKYAISNHLKCYKKLTQLMVIQIISKYEFIFSFQTKEIAQRFLDNFENELKEFYEIN